MKATKILALGGLLAAGLLTNGIANAACNGTLAQLIPAYSCVDQDKTWSNFTVTGFPLDSFFIINTQTSSGIDRHTFNVLPSNGTAGGTIQYTIEVNAPEIALGLQIDSVDLSSGVTTSTVTVNKFIWTDAFDGASLAGSPLIGLNGTEPPTIVAANTKLWIRDVVVVAGGQLTNFANTFTEITNRVPVPGTLALIGLGLAGLGARGRARKA